MKSKIGIVILAVIGIGSAILAIQSFIESQRIKKEAAALRQELIASNSSLENAIREAHYQQVQSGMVLQQSAAQIAELQVELASLKTQLKKCK